MLHFVSSAVNSQDAPSISLVAGAIVVRKGSPVCLICYAPSSLSTFVAWQKSIPVTPTVKLATNAMLESTYKPITKYVLSEQNPVPNKPNLMAFHFNITSEFFFSACNVERQGIFNLILLCPCTV